MLNQAKEAADLVISLVIASAKAREDGQLTIGDALFFTPVLATVIPGVKGISMVKAEILSEPDSEEILMEYIKTKLALELDPFEVLDDIVLNVLDVVISLIYLSQNIKDLKAPQA